MEWMEQELGGGLKFFFWLIKRLKSFFVKAGQTMREAKPPRGRRSGFTAAGLMRCGVLFGARFQGCGSIHGLVWGAPGLVPTQWVAAAEPEDSNQRCKRTAGKNELHYRSLNEGAKRDFGWRDN